MFLDVDGVLHPHGSPEDRFFTESCMEALAHVTSETRAHIVLSSSWREFPARVTLLHTALEGRGLPLPIGSTGSSLFGGRTAEIRSWLIKHSSKGRYPQWVAIDDMWMPGLRAHLVHCRSSVGLTMAKAEEAVQMLKASSVMTLASKGVNAFEEQRGSFHAPPKAPVSPDSPSTKSGTAYRQRAQSVASGSKWNVARVSLARLRSIELDVTQATVDGKTLYDGIDDLCQAMLRNDVRAQLGLHALGKGANAQVCSHLAGG